MRRLSVTSSAAKNNLLANPVRLEANTEVALQALHRLTDIRRWLPHWLLLWAQRGGALLTHPKAGMGAAGALSGEGRAGAHSSGICV